MVGWSELVSERYSPSMLTSLRAHWPQLPTAPAASAWYPLAFQLAITRLLYEEGHDGDECATVRALVDHTLASIDHRVVRAASWLGPRRIFDLAPKIFPQLYDFGACEAQTTRKVANLRWTGSTVFSDDMWRLLQRAALLGVEVSLWRGD